MQAVVNGVGSAGPVAVYCGSSAGVDPKFAAAAAELGSALAGAGRTLVYGGGDVGLMGIVADAAMDAGGKVIGVIPEHLVRHELAHHRVTSLEVTDSMHERKARMAELATGFVALPGGFGTFEEVLEILTWTQLGLNRHPVILLDVAGFYQRLFDFFDHAVESGLLKERHRAAALRASSVAEAIELLERDHGEVAPKWVDIDR